MRKNNKITKESLSKNEVRATFGEIEVFNVFGKDRDELSKELSKEYSEIFKEIMMKGTMPDLVSFVDEDNELLIKCLKKFTNIPNDLINNDLLVTMDDDLRNAVKEIGKLNSEIIQEAMEVSAKVYTYEAKKYELLQKAEEIKNKEVDTNGIV